MDNMKEFIFYYRMSVSIEAETFEEAQQIFEETNLTDLNPEYVELQNIEER